MTVNHFAVPSVHTALRWCGRCLLTGAALLTAGYWLRPPIEKEYIDQFAGPAALASSLLTGAGSLLLLLGLPGLFARQMAQTGKGGLVSAGLSFTGLAAFHLGTLALYFVLPVLVHHAPQTRSLLYSDAPPFPRFALFWALGLLVQAVGLGWYALLTLRARVFPRPAAGLLLTGALLLAAAPGLNFGLLQPATTAVMLGLAWCGAALLRQPAPVAEAQPVAI